MKKPKILLVLNRESYNFQRLRTRDGIQALWELHRFGQVHVRETRYGGHATQIVRENIDKGYDMVISAGGDGTLNEVVNGLFGHNVPLGILPLGITNVFALELGIPMNPLKAVHVILNGKFKEVDLGEANGRLFTMMAGAGLDGYVIHNLSHEFKKKYGAPSHIIEGLRSYRTYTPSPIKIQIDGKDLGTGYEVIVANTSSYGGKFKISPVASVDDGYLDVVIFRNSGILKDTRYFFSVIINRHLYLEDVSIYRAKKISLAGIGVYYHIDSEKGGMLPVDIEVKEKAVKVYAP